MNVKANLVLNESHVLNILAIFVYLKNVLP